MGPNTIRFLAAGAMTLVPASAPGFYFAGWPGDGVPRTPTLIKPGTEILVPAKGLQVQEIEAIDPGTEGRDPGQPTTPPDVPEPATLLLAAAGVAAVAAGRKLAGLPAKG